ncbi:MAG TPA: hypothetical protein VFO34_05125, partial [Candidatus Acidoferrales bacterium]|nr:hypothetical protein [Candidatus Acidoferrales bacterium]
MGEKRSDGGESRRNFLREMAAVPLAAVPFAGFARDFTGSIDSVTPAANRGESQTVSNVAPGKKFVAIQIGARSFVDEGVEKCLDTLQEKGGVNALMSTVFTYGRGLAGRQTPGQPLPDHGVQQYDEVHGGSYTRIAPEFYAKSVIKDVRAPDLGDFDILADVTPSAKKRGMQTYALF